MKKHLNEDGLPSVANINGMGNPTLPSDSVDGSGDKFTFSDKKNSKSLKNFKEFLKSLEENQSK